MSTRTAARSKGKTASTATGSRQASRLLRTVATALADMKAVNVKVLDVRGLTDVADTLIVASGTSDRHVRSIAERIIEQAKAGGMRPLGIEGEREGEWVLVDLQDIVIHVMLPRVREFYALERLWGADNAQPTLEAGTQAGRAP